MVTIGIPTRDRVDRLCRAVASALAQDYAPLEVVISDNASSDGTSSFCSELAKRDQRIRYLRHDRNHGAVRNFEAALREAKGEYFMWLADDDWLDADYLTRCVDELRLDPKLQLVAGRTSYYQGDECVFDAERIDVTDTQPDDRLLAYYRLARTNSVFYGVTRTVVLREVLPLKECFGSDWLIAAFLAYRGGVQTLTETTLHRSLGGISFDIDVARQMGLGPTGARAPFAWLTAAIGTDILGTRKYRGMRRRQRLSLALRCEFVAVRRLLLGRRLAKHRPRLASLLRTALPPCTYRWVRVHYLSSTGKMPTAVTQRCLSPRCGLSSSPDLVGSGSQPDGGRIQGEG